MKETGRIIGSNIKAKESLLPLVGISSETTAIGEGIIIEGISEVSFKFDRTPSLKGKTEILEE